MNTPSLEEQQAVTYLKQGNLEGLETLVRLYQVRAVYSAYLIVRDLKLAEDIVQTAFIHAAQKIEQFDQRRPFGAWFFRSVINASIKAARQQNRTVPLDAVQDGEGGPWMEWLLDPRPGPDQVIETAETRQMVWKALEQLPPEQRAVIVMRHFLEMKETEMTFELRRPATTIRWWLRSARKKLREVLLPLWRAEYPENDPDV